MERLESRVVDDLVYLVNWTTGEVCFKPSITVWGVKLLLEYDRRNPTQYCEGCCLGLSVCWRVRVLSVRFNSIPL